MRPGLWETIDARYPGVMITKEDTIPLARLATPLSAARLAFVSSAGVQPGGTLPFDVAHPIGDYSFRRVPSTATPADLEIHQIKYPTAGANRDLNVIFPIERLRELAAEGAIGGLTPSFVSFIGYNMDPGRLERTLAEDIADAVVAEGADIALLAPAWPLWHQSVALVQRALERRGVPTVSVTVARDITERSKPPRAVFVPFMMGHHFGVPFHHALQRRIILESLDRLETAGRSGDIHDLPVTWAQARREGREIERGLEKEHGTA